MKKFAMTILVIALAWTTTAAQSAGTVSWNGVVGGNGVSPEIDTSFFSQKIKGLKSSTLIDVVSFSISFTSAKLDNYSFDVKSDKLPREVIAQLMQLPDKRIDLYFNNVKGMSSTGLSYHVFNGQFTLVKPEISVTRDPKTKGK